MMLAPRRGSSVSVPLKNHCMAQRFPYVVYEQRPGVIMFVYKIGAYETRDALAILKRITNIVLFGATLYANPER